MLTLRIEQDRGFGWQVRAEGEVPATTTVEMVCDQSLRLALNGRVRAFLGGEQVFYHRKLTKKQAAAVFGL